MGWFKSKEEEGGENSLLPDLPSLPEIAPASKSDAEVFSSRNLELNELPPLPNSGDTPGEAGIYQKMQRSEFKPIPHSEEDFIEPSHKVTDTKKHIKSADRHFKSSGLAMKESEPIYVRLDKFKLTIETFEEIKDKITEIEALLKGIKEIKTREEEELVEWEREIEIIKSRIESLDRDIFDKLN